MSDTTLAAGRSIPIARGAAEALFAELRADRFFYGLLATWIGFTIVVAVVRQDGFLAEMNLYAERAAGSLVTLLAVVFLVVTARTIAARPDRPSAAIATAMVGILGRGTVLRFLGATVLFALFMGTFLYHKTLIPRLQPFAWDEAFAHWDAFLFAGHQPWELLMPPFGSAYVTLFLDYAYALWIPAIFVFWAWLYASPRVAPAVRRRYWNATVLSWILLGVGMATSLSSAGPVFTPVLFPDLAPAYAPLNDHLNAVHAEYGLSSEMTKRFLWAAYSGETLEPGGISAMPSMHNAQAMLFVLAGYKVSRLVGHAMLAYAVVIFLASILLAWHYAVDGLVGMAGAAAIWFATGLFHRRNEQDPV